MQRVGRASPTLQGPMAGGETQVSRMSLSAEGKEGRGWGKQGLGCGDGPGWGVAGGEEPPRSWGGRAGVGSRVRAERSSPGTQVSCVK